jgi:hypothetical protein
MGTALRRIFGPERAEVTGGWRQLHKQEFHNLYFSLNITRIINSKVGGGAMGGICRAHETAGICLQIFDVRDCREETTWMTEA